MVNPMNGLILTPEQKALRLVERRHSEKGQIALNERAIERAIVAVNHDLSEEGGQPSFTAVLGALGNSIAAHLAQLTDDTTRRRMIAMFAQELPHQVESRVAMLEAEEKGRQ
jgi:hypothetical protein